MVRKCKSRKGEENARKDTFIDLRGTQTNMWVRVRGGVKGN